MLLIILSIKLIFTKYSPSSLATVNNTKSNISISFPREDAYICLQNSFISIEFEVLKQNITRYVDNDQKSLVNFVSISLFSEADLVTGYWKHLENVDNLHAVCLTYKLLTSSQLTSKLMYGFEESEATRRLEPTNHKEVRIKLTDVFGHADQEKITYGLGYNISLQRNDNNDHHKG